MMGTTCKAHGREWWMVTKRQCNHSAFNGYHYTPSRYSTVMCARCMKHWRTMAGYVPELPDAPAQWWKISQGELARWIEDRNGAEKARRVVENFGSGD